MRVLITAIFLCCHCLAGFAADFDVIVVGTSPIALLEALYRHYTGNRVLIIEEAPECGGSWQSIDICGVSRADLGCHDLGSNCNIMTFLQDYVGCQIVSLDNPHLPYDSGHSRNGFYFSKGCHEMVDHLVEMVKRTDITLLLNHKLESVYIDPIEPVAFARTQGKQISASKILVTAYSDIKIENHPSLSLQVQNQSRSKYFHLYLLIEDETCPRFTYHSGIGGEGVSRMMNLSYFVGIENTGQQLIVLQLYSDRHLEAGQMFVDLLKKHNLIDHSARLLRCESCVYEQPYYNQSLVTQVPNGNQVFEMLQTGNIQSIATYVHKWMRVIPPYHAQVALQE